MTEFAGPWRYLKLLVLTARLVNIMNKLHVWLYTRSYIIHCCDIISKVECFSPTAQVGVKFQNLLPIIESSTVDLYSSIYNHKEWY